jgi:hypothetical protein
MIRRRLQAGQLGSRKETQVMLFTTNKERPLRVKPRRLPLLQPIRLFGIPK